MFVIIAHLDLDSEWLGSETGPSLENVDDVPCTSECFGLKAAYGCPVGKKIRPPELFYELGFTASGHFDIHRITECSQHDKIGLRLGHAGLAESLQVPHLWAARPLFGIILQPQYAG